MTSIDRNSIFEHPDFVTVKRMIRMCLNFFMNKIHTVDFLSEHAEIDPAFTTAVWEKLEECNVVYYENYHLRLGHIERAELFVTMTEHKGQLHKDLGFRDLRSRLLQNNLEKKPGGQSKPSLGEQETVEMVNEDWEDEFDELIRSMSGVSCPDLTSIGFADIRRESSMVPGSALKEGNGASSSSSVPSKGRVLEKAEEDFLQGRIHSILSFLMDGLDFGEENLVRESAVKERNDDKGLPLESATEEEEEDPAGKKARHG